MMVLSNAETFEKIRQQLQKEERCTLSDTTLAALLGGVSRTTMVKLMVGKEKVSYGTVANKVMKAITDRWPNGIWEGFALSDLFVEETKTRIPETPDKFLEIKHGYYVNNNRFETGKLEWFHEQMKFSEVEYTTSGRFLVKGVSTLDHLRRRKIKYEVTINRWDDRSCVIMAAVASGELKNRDIRSSAGIFTHIYDGILCGTWTGVNLAWLPATYPYLLSPKLLKEEECSTICEELGLFSRFGIKGGPLAPKAHKLRDETSPKDMG